MNKKVLMQTFKEFWIQSTISILWTIYIYYTTNVLTIPTLITHFSAAFFFTSWIFGQLLRIKKQQKIEDEFQHVKEELQKLLNKIQEQTKYLIGHTTGGDSIGYFTPTIYMGTKQLSFMFSNETEFPIFDIFAEWIDLDEKIDPTRGVFWTRHRINLGSLYAHRVAMDVFGFDITKREKLRINIFIQTRSRNITQQVRVVKVENNLKIAHDIISENFKKTEIPVDFPGYDPLHPEKIFQ